MTRYDALDDKAESGGRGAPAGHLLPYFPGYRNHGIPRERGNNEKAQAIACHESPKTTKLYDRTGDEITLDEVERIVI